MDGSSGSYDPAEASHQALRGIQQELERHPIVTGVRGFPSGEFTQVTATIETKRWGINRTDPTLTVRWYGGQSQKAPPVFSFHYSDDETDFGWHHHEQDHVDGRGHFQKRSDGSGYSYEPHDFGSHNPAHLVWEIMSLLSSELKSESTDQ